ncbi:hypothetical protein AVEN_102299-1 [Araneus ventricosus]|uniref:Uncharacterized protein n=1 Tax=Araneus ventricosus TaxID=182803 RepID=A0A4Y2IHR8_ARAVE|nr:hypothetical protein AVEN_102299-1 [Araneus ventricosus]
MWLAGWCHMVGGCEEAFRGIMDWCANSPKEQNEVSARSNLCRCDGKGSCPVKNTTSFRVLVDLLQANYRNDDMNEPPSISIILSHLPSGHHLLTYNCFDERFGNSSGASGKFSVSVAFLSSLSAASLPM